MNSPLIHPVSSATIAHIIANPPQSLLISGPVGVGLGTVAGYIASSIAHTVLTVLPEKDEKVDIEKGTITVASIRKLYIQTRTIQSGALVIVIDYAERMAKTAQNAFLKLLEEPGSNSYFILASHQPDALLPTIRSRTQHIVLRPISKSQTESFIDSLKVSGATKRNQLLFMASGLPAELTRLTESTEYFDYRASSLRDARDLLQANTYTKLRVIHTYKDNREKALQLLEDASKILHRTISDTPDSSIITQIDGLLNAYERISANGNIRLCLTRLVI